MSCKKRVWILSIIALLLVPIVFSEQESFSPLDTANTIFSGIHAYSKIIDFFVFFVIFTTVSLIGLKAMFKDKETNKQIIALAVAIGVMSSLALIFGGTFLGREISVFSLFPFALGFLIFCVILLPIFLIFHFLMGKKHPVWAFLIALIITLLLYFLLIRPIAFPSTLQDSGKSGSSFMEDLSKVFSSGKKAGVKKPKPTTKKPSEKVNGTENKTVSGKPDEKKETPPTIITKSENCNEISSFTVDAFFEKIWDKANNKYKDKGDKELERLDGLYNKCNGDKKQKIIGEEDFYTATMNYHMALTKGWFMVGQITGKEEHFYEADDAIQTANEDTGGKGLIAKGSIKESELLTIWYGLIEDDLRKELSIAKSISDKQKKDSIIKKINTKASEIVIVKNSEGLFIYSRKYLN